ncbi:MAG: hypothetical protein WB245_05250 [Acidimicrobiia bacterium]
MPRYMMVYKGEATDTSEMTDEDAAAVMTKWGTWMGRVGDSLADVGSPFGPGISVVDDGTTAPPISLSGYSIVEAEDLARAAELADGHPYLSDHTGDFAIDIFELMPVPFET